jgi:RNA polymerase-binding protein DksA
MSTQETPVNSTPFSEEELQHFKVKLQEEQNEAQKKIDTFQNRIDELEQKMDDTKSSSAHHQGNIASSEEEREKYYTMIEKEKDKLEEIKVALDKIETGNYGICNVSGKPIQKERLEIKPYARYSVEAVKSKQGDMSPASMQVQDS